MDRSAVPCLDRAGWSRVPGLSNMQGPGRAPARFQILFSERKPHIIVLLADLILLGMIVSPQIPFLGYDLL